MHDIRRKFAFAMSGDVSGALDLSGFHRGQDRVRELRCAARATHIAGQAFAFGVHGLQCLLDFIRRGLLVKMVQHQYGGLKKRCRRSLAHSAQQQSNTYESADSQMRRSAQIRSVCQLSMVCHF